jgi:hypothetical protein
MVKLVDEAQRVAAQRGASIIVERRGFLATLYPAWKAASTDPVQVLRYE